MNYSTMTEREVEIELSTTAEEGLTSFKAHDRLIENGRNLPEKAYAKSVFSVAVSQLTNLYTIAFIVMGAILALFQFEKNSIACFIFFAVAVVNMVSGFLRDYGERKNAVAFDKKRSGEVKIIRDGKIYTTDPTLLVKGDVVILEKDDFVPADIRILECEDLKADESIFKGRNTPCDKKSGACGDEVDFAECPNMLYCGTVIASGKGKGAVVATAKDTVLAKVNMNRSKKLDMHDKFGKNAESEKILVCAAIATAIFVLVYTMLGTKDFSMSIVRACMISMCLLPAPCFIVRMMGTHFCSWELKRANVKMDSGDFVYDIGMGEYFLFDKGGLLTKGDVKLEEKVVSDNDSLCMAVICSDIECVGNEITGNDMDVATAKYLVEEGYDIKKLTEDNKKILFMPFDEKRMLMAALIKKDNIYRLIVKGSVEAIPTLCSAVSDNDEVLEMNGEILHRLEQISSSMAEKGLKIRVLAYRDIEEIPQNIENEIKSLTFVGILGYRELLTDGASEAVEKLERVFVKPVMVTGDHRITAFSLAKSAGLVRKESECISFHEIGDCSDEELFEYCNRYKVFASATSNDRERLVRALSENKANVLVAGDGMTAPSVSMYAAASFGNESMTDCDVITEKNDVDSISEVIYRSRSARGNLAYASLLAISVGFAEVLCMIYLMLTGGILPTVNEMILTNIFVVFVPCLAICTFAGVHHKLGQGRLLAVRCALEGVICALMCIASGEDIVTFAALYAIVNALRICASYNNLEKGRWGIAGSIALLLILAGAVIALSSSVAELLLAVAASAINAALPYIKLKGLNKNV